MTERDDPIVVTIMKWVYLTTAGLLEIVWVIAMKQSNGFTRLSPSMVTAVAMAGSFGLLALALRSLPLGTAYVLWTGIGAVGAFTAGIVLFGDSFSASRVTAAGLIVAGMVILKMS